MRRRDWLKMAVLAAQPVPGAAAAIETQEINWLESQGVELIEQPLPVPMIEEAKWVRKRVHIPILADEAYLHPTDIPKVADAFDGINIKLAKCGGVLETSRMIQIALSLGLKAMLGCMIESSVGVTAAAHLSPLEAA